MSRLERIDELMGKANEQEPSSEENSSLTSDQEVSEQSQLESVPESQPESVSEEEVVEQPVAEKEVEEHETEVSVPTDHIQPNYDDYIEKNGYKSKEEFEELSAKYQEVEQKLATLNQEPQIDDPLFQAIKQRYISGEGIDMNYLRQQLIDYDSYDANNADHAKGLIMEGLLSEGMTPEEAQLEWDYKYGDMSEYDPDEREYKKLEQKMKLEANRFKRELKKAQQENRLPNSDYAQKQQEERARVEQAQKQWKDNWTQTIPNEIGKIDGLSLRDDITYQLSESDKASLQSELKKKVIDEMDFNFTGKYFDEKKRTWDVSSMIEDVAWGSKSIRGKLLEKLATETKSEGSDDILKVTKNAQTETKSVQEIEKSPEEAANDLGLKMLSDLNSRFSRK